MYVGQPRRRGMVMGNNDIGGPRVNREDYSRAYSIQTFIRHFSHARKVLCQALGKYRN
jgi:hypothetical protein